MNQTQLDQVPEDLRQFLTDSSEVEPSIALPEYQHLDDGFVPPAALRGDYQALKATWAQLNETVYQWLTKYARIAAIRREVILDQSELDQAVMALTKPLTSYSKDRHGYYVNDSARKVQGLQRRIASQNKIVAQYLAISDALDVSDLLSQYRSQYENFEVRYRIFLKRSVAKPRAVKQKEKKAIHYAKVISSEERLGVDVQQTIPFLLEMENKSLVRITDGNREFGVVPQPTLLKLFTAMNTGLLYLSPHPKGIEFHYAENSYTSHGVVFNAPLGRKSVISTLMLVVD